MSARLYLDNSVYISLQLFWCLQSLVFFSSKDIKEQEL